MDVLEKITALLTDIRKTLILSIVLHLLVALLLMLGHIRLDFDRPEFTEINFISGEEPVSRAPAPAEETQEPEPRVRRQQEQEPPESPPVQEEVETGAVPVELPKRRMMEETEPELAEQTTGKLTENRRTEQRRITPTQSEGDRVGERDRQRTSGEKLSASPQKLPLQERGALPTSEVGEPARAQPFTIEGEAANREIAQKVIPDYPENLQQEAVIKIRFTVLPDGRVGQMIPVQKDYPALEELTLEALEKWRFNPLPPGAKQQPVQGTITFRYELE